MVSINKIKLQSIDDSLDMKSKIKKLEDEIIKNQKVKQVTSKEIMNNRMKRANNKGQQQKQSNNVVTGTTVRTASSTVNNEASVNRDSLEVSAQEFVVESIVKVVNNQNWEGSFTKLKSALRRVTRSNKIPRTPSALSHMLRSSSEFLRKAGLEVSYKNIDRKIDGVRTKAKYVIFTPMRKSSKSSK